MEVFSFENLNAYKESRKLVVEVYKLLNNLPDYELYVLSAQLRRSITSVPSNIAEGSGRMSYKEKIHYLEIAFGSLLESYCQLEVCRDLNYISDDALKGIKPQFFIVSRLINALRKSFINKISTPNSQ